MRTPYGPGFGYHLLDDEIRVATDLLANPFTREDSVRELEADLSALAEVRGAVAVTTGTSALLLLLRAAGVRRGDVVVTTPITFVSTVTTILALGAHPCFVDVDATTGMMDLALLRGTLERLTAAGRPTARSVPGIPEGTTVERTARVFLLPVQLYGQAPDLDAVAAQSAKFQCPVLWDATEAVGARYRTCSPLSAGIASAVAFSSGKQLWGGQGGAVLSNDENLLADVRVQRDYGREPDTGRVVIVSLNHHMDPLRAAIVRAQIPHLPARLEARQRVHQQYVQSFAQVPEVQLVRDEPWMTTHARFCTVITTATSDLRERVVSRLRTAGVPFKLYFAPMHRQPALMSLGYDSVHLPAAENFGRTCLALPCSPAMQPEDAGAIAHEVRSAAQSRS